MEETIRNSDHDSPSSGSSDEKPKTKLSSQRSRSKLFCDHCAEWVSKSTFYRHRAKRSEHPETVSDSSTSESSAEDTNSDKCAREKISDSVCDDQQGNQSASQPSTDDSSQCTEPSDVTDSSSETVQEQVRS